MVIEMSSRVRERRQAEVMRQLGAWLDSLERTRGRLLGGSGPEA